jgi:hypothetical protein
LEVYIVGAWETGIFDDDLALDIKDIFEEALKENGDIQSATEHILNEYEDVIEDEDDGPIVYLALGVLQLEHGSIQPEIKEQVIDIIEHGRGLERWEEAGKEALENRKNVLEELKKRILNS